MYGYNSGYVAGQPGYVAGQPGYGPAYGPQPMVGGMVPAQITYANYRELSRGPGIDPVEYSTIVNVIVGTHQQYQLRGNATAAAQAIKMRLGGDWMVLITDMNYSGHDMSITRCKGGDMMAFALDNRKYEVIRC